MASPSPSPAATGTDVSVSATINFNNTSVTINSQNITDLQQNGLVFGLTNPVDMGSFADLVTWMHDNLGLDITEAEIDGDIDQLPEPFKSVLSGFFHADVTLTTLNVNTNTSTYAVGASIAPNPPFNILNILQVEKIGLQVSSTGSSSTSP